MTSYAFTRRTPMTVMIGIDPHKASHMAVAIDGDEHALARGAKPQVREFPTLRTGHHCPSGLVDRRSRDETVLLTHVVVLNGAVGHAGSPPSAGRSYAASQPLRVQEGRQSGATIRRAVKS